MKTASEAGAFNKPDARLSLWPKEIDIVKRMLMLTAAMAALSVFRFARAAVAAARARSEKQDLKQEIRRWEDEGGNVVVPAPGQSAIPGATS